MSSQEPRIPESVVRARFTSNALEFVGRGGQSDVWRLHREGRDEVLRILVAVSEPARVQREVDALQVTSSPHLMEFYGLEQLEHEGRSYPVIRGEFIAGGTVADKLEADGLPSVVEALACAAGALRALMELHRIDLVHRDVKPGNLGLRGGEWAQTVVLDLGYIRDLGAPPLTVYPSRIGTIPFMAPEQLMLRPAGLRTDIYALGIVVFLLLSGRHPFLEEREEVPLEQYLERMESETWPDWELVGGLDEDEIALLRTMLAFDAHQRPRARAALGAVESFLERRR